MSGYRHRRASELAEKQDIPAHIYEVTMREATAYRKAVKNNSNAPIPGKLLDPSADKDKGTEVPAAPGDKGKQGKVPAVPTIIQRTDDADAKIILADGNLHRDKISSYNLSLALRMKTESMKQKAG